ncbi:hypothetical protein CMUS01_16233 [Colletotrichum musicola]|uniref:Uncharacterized protein n=1 Tax=Colletotrichum musicola TaxID=2175873 RepID=A0A8H6MK06_9PEZI|nr:hypothetical protein CMUS01_16233 [Colletotrichum musicola]
MMRAETEVTLQARHLGRGAAWITGPDQHFRQEQDPACSADPDAAQMDLAGRRADKAARRVELLNFSERKISTLYELEDVGEPATEGPAVGIKRRMPEVEGEDAALQLALCRPPRDGRNMEQKTHSSDEIHNVLQFQVAQVAECPGNLVRRSREQVRLATAKSLTCSLTANA